MKPVAIAAVLAALAVLLGSFGWSSTTARSSGSGGATDVRGSAAGAVTGSSAVRATDRAANSAVRWSRGAAAATVAVAVRSGAAAKSASGDAPALPAAAAYLLGALLLLGLAHTAAPWARGVRGRVPQGRAPPATSGS